MGTKILVAEDEDTLRSVITAVLRDDGHEVLEAADGQAAFELYREDPCPVVITDVMMPKMDGLTLLREVRSINPDAQMIVMTANATLDTAMQALRAGACEFIIKPIEEIDLISVTVNRAVEKSSLILQNRQLVERLTNQARELEQLNKTLASMANRDGLTGVYNRRFLHDTLKNELARAERHGRVLSAIFLDVDHFKTYNDTYGHLAGDQLLVGLANILVERCRKTDIIARYGGDEFVVLLPETEKHGAVTCAESVRQAVEEHGFAQEGAQTPGRATISIGVASFPEDAGNVATLLERADKALYGAKIGDRNKVVGYEWEEPTPAG